MLLVTPPILTCSIFTGSTPALRSYVPERDGDNWTKTIGEARWAFSQTSWCAKFGRNVLEIQVLEAQWTPHITLIPFSDMDQMTCKTVPWLHHLEWRSLAEALQKCEQVYFFPLINAKTADVGNKATSPTIIWLTAKAQFPKASNKQSITWFLYHKSHSFSCNRVSISDVPSSNQCWWSIRLSHTRQNTLLNLWKKRISVLCAPVSSCLGYRLIFKPFCISRKIGPLADAVICWNLPASIPRQQTLHEIMIRVVLQV